MIIKYPKDLLAQVNERIKGHNLTGFTPGMGPKHPTIMLIGEAPGRHEAKVNIPFSGSSGQELMKMIAIAGLTRDDVYITSVVRSRPFSIKKVNNRQGEPVTKYPNRTPTKAEVLAYAQLFDWELQTIQPQILVPLGNTSLQRLLGSKANIGELHGQPINSPIQKATADDSGYQMSTEEYLIFPMYHPAAYLYARRLEPTVRKDWENFDQWLKKLKKEGIVK